ncbi:glycosyltransferase involved in cell wall biosynthesis [Actinomadura cellulosilytica]|uniref:Glycosyltransferase involved in cell wall biosynthesis n=1 Tax=Thermomonospora cellulosilytica TaxID=1411118 RepID=A0A7W3N5R2_9ACTN|nr:glycosyltransferase involved in cell wall biosynthesis [Thermomonospora cellulosilytica]
MQRYVPEMMRGLAGNVRNDIEFIVVNDGSADSTPDVVEDHRSLVPGLRLVHHDRPLGVNAARNRGIAEAQGRYLMFHDGDDWMAPGHLFDLVAAIERLGCDFLRTDHIQVTGRRRVLHRAPQGRRDIVLPPRDSILPVHEPTMVDYPGVFTGIYRRELADAGVLLFDERVQTATDRPFIWQLFRTAESYAVVSLAGVFYRRGVATSLTQIGDERQLHFFDAFDIVLAGLADDPDRDRFLRKAVRTYLALIVRHLNLQDRLLPELRERLHARAVATIRALPGPLVAETLPALGLDRMRVLSETLGIEVGAL